MEKQYDIAVIGGGIGGYSCAIRASQLGLHTALIEQQQVLGGTCLNVGCIPSKALLSATALIRTMQEQAPEMGILASGLKVDLKKMMQHKDGVVSKLTGGLAALLKQNGVSVYFGEAETRGPQQLIVHPAGSTKEQTVVSAKNIVLATGSRVREIPGLSFDGELIIDSTDALSMDKVPESLAIAGAGPIGLEMASIWSRLGSRVTVIEMMDMILPGWDLQLAKTLKGELEKQGMEFRLASQISSWEKKGSGLEMIIEKSGNGGEDGKLKAEKLLVAAGRRPYCPEKILTDLSLKVDQSGRLLTDEKFSTGTAGVFALGDAAAGPMLAHKAEEEGIALAEILAGRPGGRNHEAIPGVVYTDPEAASVGKTEEQLREMKKSIGREYSKGIFHFKANGKALASGHQAGFVKVLADKQTDRLLGVHIVGSESGILIQEAVSVMAFRGSAEDIGRTIHAHPTLSETVKEASMAAFDKPLHGF